MSEKDLKKMTWDLFILFCHRDNKILTEARIFELMETSYDIANCFLKHYEKMETSNNG